MTKFKRIIIHSSIALLAGVTFFSCDEDINQQIAPVLLVANITEVLSQWDIADADCGNIALYELRAQVKDTTLPGGGLVDTRFLDVLIRTRRTTYVRTDGGTVAPRTFIENLDILVPATGAAANLPTTSAFSPAALSEAPFVALRPEAGGRDPETGQRFVRLEVIVEFFGETLSGQRVATSVRFPLTICMNCGGCLPDGGA